MILGQVLGSLTSVRKHDQLAGSKFLIVQPQMSSNADVIVAIDTVGAGAGDQVLVVMGSSAREALLPQQSIVDAAIVGIVDQVNVQLRQEQGDSK